MPGGPAGFPTVTKGGRTGMERTEDTATFLRRTARALRELADAAPEIAEALHRLARDLDDEADELATPDES